MQKEILTIEYELYDSREELLPQERELAEAALKASENAYAPYSKFCVGAAVRLDNGVIVCGNNQENASYPQGLCAERVALFYALAQYPTQKVTAIAVCGNPKDFTLSRYLSPCGGCRQTLVECEQRAGSKIKIILLATQGQVTVIEGTEQLLPFQFSPQDLHNPNKIPY